MEQETETYRPTPQAQPLSDIDLWGESKFCPLMQISCGFWRNGQCSHDFCIHGGGTWPDYEY